MLIVWIAIFGALGTLARYGVALVMPPWGALPLGSLTVNLTGSFLIGLIWGSSLHSSSPAPSWMAVVTTGFLGGFTTFSAFSLETVRLFAHHKLALGALYLVTTPVACSLAAGLGAWATYAFTAK